MTVLELREKLIGKINKIDNNELLEDMVRLLENEETSLSVYKLSSEQKKAVEEAQEQI